MFFVVRVYTPRREVCHVNAARVRDINQVDRTQNVRLHDFAFVCSHQSTVDPIRRI